MAANRCFRHAPNPKWCLTYLHTHRLGRLYIFTKPLNNSVPQRISLSICLTYFAVNSSCQFSWSFCISSEVIDLSLENETILGGHRACLKVRPNSPHSSLWFHISSRKLQTVMLLSSIKISTYSAWWPDLYGSVRLKWSTWGVLTADSNRLTLQCCSI